MHFSAAAREQWAAVYPTLSKIRPGMHRAATARAEAHTARLALIYALLDACDHIAAEHLDAALAVWTFADQSARWIFGDSLGNPTADDIWALATDRPAGISRTEIRDLFSRNKKARGIDRALGTLVDTGRLQRTVARAGPGRPAEMWVPAEVA